MNDFCNFNPKRQNNFVNLFFDFLTMKIRFYIMLMVTLGFFLTPILTYACETKIEKSCCENKSSSKSEKKECCKNHSSNKDNDNSCGGKCGHSNCTTTSAHLSLLFFEDLKLINNFDFSNEKQNFYDAETNLSSGFHSIWLIPKIS